MKFNKLAAAGATLALAVGSVVGIGAAANAIEVPVEDIGAETNPYPIDEWFLGNVSGGNGPVPTQDATGLTIVGPNQLLYGQSTTGVDTALFTDLIEGAGFEATGDATFQVSVFFDPTDANVDGNLLFTTLRPAAPGSPEASGLWTASRAIPSLGVAANTPVEFSVIASVFDLAIVQTASPEILAFGVFVNPGETAVLESVTWDGETWTFATPTAAPAVPVQNPATFTG